MKYSFGHKNIVKTFGYYTEDMNESNSNVFENYVRILMKYYKHGSLEEWYKKQLQDQREPSQWCSVFDSGIKISIISDLINAIIYLEINEIVHGDICPQNILIDQVDNEIIAVLADFGGAVNLNKSM